MDSKKVLVINTVGLDYEGMTTVIYNYTEAMDKVGQELHFLATHDTALELKNRFAQLGTLDYICGRKKDFFGYIKGLYMLLQTKFDVVHVHGNSGTMLIEVLLAKLHGVKNVIIHSHNTKTNHPVINNLLKVPMMRLADTCIACSNASGEWLYGKYPHIVLNNAIDLNRFRFSEDAREKYRTEFGIKEEFLIGHIGHFNAQKNHFFLIDIFYEFHKLEPNSKLLLLSDGPRFEQVKAKVTELELQDVVIFAGRRNNIAEIYSAMDLFILPSCWEGLPLTIVEAQANGLPVLASDVITEDAICCPERVQFKSLEDGAESWAKQLKQIKDCSYNRKTDTHGDIAEKGFDIHTEAEKLRSIYLQ